MGVSNSFQKSSLVGVCALTDAYRSLQVGPELEVCGYGCEDHFLELDTVEHCWEALVVGFEAVSNKVSG